MKRLLLKASRDTKLFKKGQKIWVLWSTGALAASCVTKFKGKGRWIKVWAHWEDSDYNYGRSFSGKADCKLIGTVEISNDFNLFLDKVGNW